MLELRYPTPAAWTENVIRDFDHFLIDHAAAEKKASGMAMSMALHFKDRNRLVSAMIDLAIEELAHFREVVRILQQRNLQLLPDEKDAYVNGLRAHIRRGRDESCIDRLLSGSIIEARGAERFALVAAALPAGHIRTFCTSIARSEEKHYQLFLDLAKHYFANAEIESRLDELLDIEARLIESLPLRATLH